MKYEIIFGGLLAFLLFYIRIVRGLELICEKAVLTVPEIIELDRYPFEEHKVTTEDGYILTMHRIPNPGRIPVMCVHGLIESSHTWILLGPKTANETRARALAYQLFDLGYDVWLANTRGNRYSREHVSKDPDSLLNNGYWDFSFTELGKYDVPAMMDHIIDETNYQKIHYIGHSQGTTSFFAMGAIRPDYNDKIKSAHLLAPVALLEHAKSPALIAAAALDIAVVVTILGERELLSNSKLVTLISQVACNEIEPLDVCKNALFLIFGWGSTQISDEMIQCLMGHTPAGASTKQFLHFGQCKKYGTFAPYRTALSPTTPYNFAKVTAPLVLYYSLNDWTTDEGDVRKLFAALPNPKNKIFRVSEPTYNHLDFTYGANNNVLIYNEIFANIKSFE